MRVRVGCFEVPPTHARLRARGAAYSDVGPARRRNEDAFFMHDGLGLYVVADGVGGAPNGDWASAAACQVVRAHIERHSALLEALDHASSDEAAQPVVRLLVEALQHASQKIYRISGRERTHRAGTTCSAVLIRQGLAVVAHVGDSRIHRLRDEDVESWTTDHVVSQEGTEEAKRTHPAADSALTRALGPGPSTEVDTLVREVRPGDVLVLCTDGCHDGRHGRGDTVDLVGLADAPLALAPRRVVERAYARGSTDNATCVVVHIEADRSAGRS